MKTALFAHSKESLPQKTLMPGKPELFAKLAERDIEGLVSLSGEAAFSDTAVETSALVDDYSFRKVGARSLDQVGIIVNRLDRVFKLEAMPQTWLDADVPIVNKNELRSLAYRKHRMHDEVFAPLGIGMPTKLIDSVADAALFIEENIADAYIAKPTSGTFSKGVEKVARADVVSFFAGIENPGTMILQPAYDFTVPFERALQPYDKKAEADFDTWARSNATKELRMYGFYAHGATDVFPVARAMNGEDNWFFVNPESVPEALRATTHAVLARTALLSGSSSIYGALDIAYGSKTTDEAPSYEVVEFNGRMPYMIGYDKHAAVADLLRDKFADQIQQSVYDTDKTHVSK